MLLLLGSLLALTLLDSPERFVVIGALALVELLEVFVWLRWRRVRAMTGAEGIVGARGRAITDCRPEGQVKVKGQLWNARCKEGVAAGQEVVVTGAEGLTLDVADASRLASHDDAKLLGAGPNEGAEASGKMSKLRSL